MKKGLALLCLLLASVVVGGGIFFSVKQYMGEIKAEKSARSKEQETTKVVITEELQEEIIQTENKAELYRKLEGASSCIDIEFAKWLYDTYEDATSEIIESIDKGEYQDPLWHDFTGKSLIVLRDEKYGYLDSEETMRQHLIYVKECASDDVVNLCFAGDVSFANDYLPAQNFAKNGVDGAFSKDLQETMLNADIFMVNNEFCYSDRGIPQTAKKYYFRAAPERVQWLEQMGVDIVSIANNHAYDYGEDAFVDTMDTLNSINMPYVGGGMDIEDATNHVVYFIANGIKIGYIAATQIERQTLFTLPATENRAGVLRCYEEEPVVEMIRRAKENCDFLIVYPHWGTEKQKKFEPDQQQLAHAFIEAGADAIVGGHPHCLQGVEYYKDTPIFYSLGNFSFSSKVMNSTILKLEVTQNGLERASYIPCMENAGQTIQCELGSEPYRRILKELNEISDNAIVDEEGIVMPK